MADGLNWNALRMPNFAAAYGQGVEFKNALADRDFDRQRLMQQDQRQVRQDARQERRDALEDERYATEQKDAEFKRTIEAVPIVGSLLRGVEDEATWNARKTDQGFRQVWSATAQRLGLPDELDNTSWAQVQQFKEMARAMEARKLFETTSGIVSVGERGEDPQLVYEDELGRRYKEAQIEATEALVGQRGASAEASRARADKTRRTPAGGGGGRPKSYGADEVDW